LFSQCAAATIPDVSSKGGILANSKHFQAGPRIFFAVLSVFKGLQGRGRAKQLTKKMQAIDITVIAFQFWLESTGGAKHLEVPPILLADQRRRHL
jgi:hypothetical protein